MAYISLNFVFVLLLFITEILAVKKGINLDYYEKYNIMKVLEGGKFLKGTNDPKSETGEYPIEVREVQPFYIDVYPVTNAMFLKFKQTKSGFRTDAELNGFSWVLRSFVNSTKDQTGGDWIEVKNATWDKPEGPGSTIMSRLEYPVVHMSQRDAKAYCEYYKKRLPTEQEWEFAARGGLYGKDYPWGDRYQKARANLWQGKFPDGNSKADKWAGVSPVDAFPPQNEFGMYDVQGNVWEWTSERYYERVVPRDEQPRMFTVKGCSFVDTRDGKYNSIVRVSQRMGLEPRYTAQNVGFRCAKEAKHYWKRPKPPPKKEVQAKHRPPGPRKHLRSEMADPDLAQKIRAEMKKKRKEEL